MDPSFLDGDEKTDEAAEMCGQSARSGSDCSPYQPERRIPATVQIQEKPLLGTLKIPRRVFSCVVGKVRTALMQMRKWREMRRTMRARWRSSSGASFRCSSLTSLNIFAPDRSLTDSQSSHKHEGQMERTLRIVPSLSLTT